MLGLCIVFHQSLSSSRNSACSSTLRFKVCKHQISSSLCCTLSSFCVIYTHMKENDRKTDVGRVIQGRAVKSFGQLNFCRTRYKPNCLFCAYTSKHVSVVGFPLGSSRSKCRFSVRVEGAQERSGVRHRGQNNFCPLGQGLVSVGGRLLVLAIGHGEEVFQLPLQRLKRRPLHWILMPAFDHYVVEKGRAALGTLHPIAMFHLV